MSRNLFIPLGLTPSGYQFKRALEWLGGALAATGALGSSAINAMAGAGSSHAARSWQYDRLHEQREWQLQDYESNQRRMKDLMDYERDYNTPAQQMVRYKEAGLNPFLAAHQGDLGAGNGSSAPSVPQPSRGEVPNPNVFYPNIDLGASSLVERMFQGSSIQNDRVRSLADFAKSLPDLVKSVGVDSAKQIAGAIFGQNVDMSIIDGMVKSEASIAESNATIQRVQADLSLKYGDKKAANFIANQEQEFNKMAAEIGKMASDAKVNEATITKLGSDFVRNMADAYKLRQEGDKYVIEADYYNAMKKLISAQVTQIVFDNRKRGYYNGSRLDNYLSSSSHQESVVGDLSITDEQLSSQLIRALDKVMGQYFKISN